MKKITWEVYRLQQYGSPKMAGSFPNEAEARLAAMNWAMEGSHHSFSGVTQVIEVTREEKILENFNRKGIMEQLTTKKVEIDPVSLFVDHDADMADD